MPPADTNGTSVDALSTGPIGEKEKPNKTAVIKRSILLNGHRTRVSLENEFWDGLREIASLERASINARKNRPRPRHL